jgi:hypothetical protein
MVDNNESTIKHTLGANGAGKSAANASPDYFQFHLENYTRLGWSVITAHGVQVDWPRRTDQYCACRNWQDCSSPGKHPVGRWKDRPRATLDSLISSREQYFIESGGHEPNWAIVLGRSNLAALDIDQHAGGADGAAAFAALIERYGPLPAGPRDSRGHYLFKLPAEAEHWPTKTDLAPAVELFTGNALADHILYVAPSRHPSGAVYKWLPGCEPWTVEPPTLPDWIIERAADLAAERATRRTVGPATSRTGPVPVPTGGSSPGYSVPAGGDVYSRARKYISTMPPAISGQGGHNAAFKVACKLVIDFALSPADAFAIMAEWNQICRPPWTDAELDRKLREADKQPGERGKLANADRRGYGGEFAWLEGQDFKWTKPGSSRTRPAGGPCHCPTPNGDGHSASPGPAAHHHHVEDFSDLTSPSAARAAREAAEEAEADRPLMRAGEENRRARFRSYRCPKYGGVLLTNGTVDVAMRLRCDSWKCSECKNYFRHRWENTFNARLVTSHDAPQFVYRVVIKRHEWDAIRQRLHRSETRLGKGHGNYAKVDLEDGTFALASVADVVPNSERLTGAEAAKRLTADLHAFRGETSPISTSRGWALPQEEVKPLGLTRLGKIAVPTEERVERFLKAVGSEVDYKPSDSEMPRRVMSRHTINYPFGFTDYQRDWVRHCLLHNLTPEGGDLCDVDGPPPPWPPEWEEKENTGPRLTANGDLDLLGGGGCHSYPFLEPS